MGKGRPKSTSKDGCAICYRPIEGGEYVREERPTIGSGTRIWRYHKPCWDECQEYEAKSIDQDMLYRNLLGLMRKVGI